MVRSALRSANSRHALIALRIEGSAENGLELILLCSDVANTL
jgi:hypothetical protein